MRDQLVGHDLLEGLDHPEGRHLAGLEGGELPVLGILLIYIPSVDTELVGPHLRFLGEVERLLVALEVIVSDALVIGQNVDDHLDPTVCQRLDVDLRVLHDRLELVVEGDVPPPLDSVVIHIGCKEHNEVKYRETAAREDEVAVVPDVVIICLDIGDHLHRLCPLGTAQEIRGESLGRLAQRNHIAEAIDQYVVAHGVLCRLYLDRQDIVAIVEILNAGEGYLEVLDERILGIIDPLGGATLLRQETEGT